MPFARLQGFGGKPITYFPPHQFFRLYLEYPSQAQEEFSRWFEDNFVEKQAWKVPKRVGGWENGSLVRAVVESHKQQGMALPDDMSKVKPELLKRAIEERVQHYFGVLESIRENGFIYGYGQQFCGIFTKQGLCYLQNGHHRTAALSVLGHSEVEVLNVKPERGFI